MHRIISGVRNFQNSVFPEQQERFEMLARKQQTPIALFITCSDSRINPNLLTSTEPGDLFLLRNAGNIVPPYGAANGGEGATVEYAISVLKMRHIIICGHYLCGAMHYLMRLDQSTQLPAVHAWCSHAEATRRIVKGRYSHLPQDAQDDLAIEQNVLVQMDNLKTHPAVAVAMARGELEVHGWAYRIETGEINVYEPASAKFVPLVEAGARPLPTTPQNNVPVTTP